MKEVKKAEKDLNEKIKQTDDKIAETKRAINNFRDNGRNYSRGNDHRGGDRGGDNNGDRRSDRRYERGGDRGESSSA